MNARRLAIVTTAIAAGSGFLAGLNVADGVWWRLAINVLAIIICLATISICIDSAQLEGEQGKRP